MAEQTEATEMSCGQSKEWHDALADTAHSTTLPRSWVRWARMTLQIDREMHRA